MHLEHKAAWEIVNTKLHPEDTAAILLFTMTGLIWSVP